MEQHREPRRNRGLWGKPWLGSQQRSKFKSWLYDFGQFTKHFCPPCPSKRRLETIFSQLCK